MCACLCFCVRRAQPLNNVRQMRARRRACASANRSCKSGSRGAATTERTAAAVEQVGAARTANLRTLFFNWQRNTRKKRHIFLANQHAKRSLFPIVVFNLNGVASPLGKFDFDKPHDEAAAATVFRRNSNRNKQVREKRERGAQMVEFNWHKSIAWRRRRQTNPLSLARAC